MTHQTQPFQGGLPEYDRTQITSLIPSLSLPSVWVGFLSGMNSLFSYSLRESPLDPELLGLSGDYLFVFSAHLGIWLRWMCQSRWLTCSEARKVVRAPSSLSCVPGVT